MSPSRPGQQQANCQTVSDQISFSLISGESCLHRNLTVQKDICGLEPAIAVVGISGREINGSHESVIEGAGWCQRRAKRVRTRDIATHYTKCFSGGGPEPLQISVYYGV